MQSTRRGSLSVHRSEKTPGSKYSSTSGLSPRGHLERQAERKGHESPANGAPASKAGGKTAAAGAHGANFFDKLGQFQNQLNGAAQQTQGTAQTMRNTAQ